MPQGSGHSASDDLKIREAGKPGRNKRKTEIKYKNNVSYSSLFTNGEKMSHIEVYTIGQGILNTQFTMNSSDGN